MTAPDVLMTVFFAAIAVLTAATAATRSELNTLRRQVESLTQSVELLDVRVCRECRCTDDIACMTGCWWVEDDLCSSCSDDLAASGSSLESGTR